MQTPIFNPNKIKKVPITRNSLFYSEKDFEYETEIGKAYVEEDCNQVVVLFEVDIEKSNLDAIYGETRKDQIVFKTPVELHCLYTIESSELQGYDKSKQLGGYIKQGNMNFGVYQSTLDELDAEIKIGDYIGIQVTEEKMIYWVVVDDGRNNFDNEKTTFGYKPSWRTVKCAPVEENEFNG